MEMVKNYIFNISMLMVCYLLGSGWHIKCFIRSRARVAGWGKYGEVH